MTEIVLSVAKFTCKKAMLSPFSNRSGSWPGELSVAIRPMDLRWRLRSE